MPTIEEIIKTSRIEDPYMRAMLNVMYTGNWLYQNMNTILKPYDLTEPQYNVLRILRGQHGNPMSLLEVQRRMIQQMSNVSRLVEKLLQKSYVQRDECSENRRKVDISITQLGLDVLIEVEPLLQQQLARLANNMNGEEATALAASLDKLRG